MMIYNANKPRLLKISDMRVPFHYYIKEIVY